MVTARNGRAGWTPPVFLGGGAERLVQVVEEKKGFEYKTYSPAGRLTNIFCLLNGGLREVFSGSEKDLVRISGQKTRSKP